MNPLELSELQCSTEHYIFLHRRNLFMCPLFRWVVFHCILYVCIFAYFLCNCVYSRILYLSFCISGRAPAWSTIVSYMFVFLYFFRICFFVFLVECWWSQAWVVHHLTGWRQRRQILGVLGPILKDRQVKSLFLGDFGARFLCKLLFCASKECPSYHDCYMPYCRNSNNSHWQITQEPHSTRKLLLIHSAPSQFPQPTCTFWVRTCLLHSSPL